MKRREGGEGREGKTGVTPLASASDRECIAYDTKIQRHISISMIAKLLFY